MKSQDYRSRQQADTLGRTPQRPLIRSQDCRAAHLNGVEPTLKGQRPPPIRSQDYKAARLQGDRLGRAAPQRPQTRVPAWPGREPTSL
eukprot:9501073-Pyramimonas_sp.AAC.1